MFIRSDNKELSNGGSLDGKVISLALEKCFVFSRRPSLSPEDSVRLWEVQSVISLLLWKILLTLRSNIRAMQAALGVQSGVSRKNMFTL